MDPRYFVDISNYSSRFQAHLYHGAGPLLVAILATDGERFVSDRHGIDAEDAHSAGLIAWHYHFARPEMDPDAIGEAAHFWQTVKPHWRAGDRLVLDVERQHPRGLTGLIKYVRELDVKLHHISGQEAIGYTYDSLLRECGPMLQVLSRQWWIAKPDGILWPLGAGRRCLARQVRLDGYGKGPLHVPGVVGFDVDQLKRWYLRELRRELRRRR